LDRGLYYTSQEYTFALDWLVGTAFVMTMVLHKNIPRYRGARAAPVSESWPKPWGAVGQE